MFKYDSYTTILINSLFRDRIVRMLFLLALLIDVLIWFFLGWSVRDLPESIPLHYNIYYGIDLYGNWYEILYLPAVGLLFLSINFILALYLYSREKILSYFLAAVSFLGLFFLALAAIFITLTNY
ncbi:MAG: hypothetical protein WCX71_02455 [Candidatus Buchananbacteria bacterium]